MTDRLYYDDAYASRFEAVVLSCTKAKNRFEIELDRTLFYPEGGGQPGDSGILRDEAGNVFNISDTHEQGDAVMHYCDREITAGAKVKGEIDFARRFDHMQQHSGEHIISGIICRRFSCSNVGFHMGRDAVTIDFDAEPSWAELMEAEREANEAIWANEPFEITIPSPEELKALTYRSKKELEGEVRIVKAGTKDICACCGTHVKSAGEVGIIKLISLKKMRGGIRLELLCGNRGYDYLAEIFEQNSTVGTLLSSRPLETSDSLRKYMERSEAERYRLFSLEEKAADEKAALFRGMGDILHFETGIDGDSLRRLTEKCAVSCGGRAAVFSKAVEGYKYCVICKAGGMKALSQQLNSALSGRGGGRDDCIQGTCMCTEDDITNFFKGLYLS